MDEVIDRHRRRFVTRAALTVAAVHLGVFDRLRPKESSVMSGAVATADAAGAQRTPRQLAAIFRASEWLNSPRLSPEHLAGKAVLVDFLTYTCINWLRTLPYVRAWTQKYRQGLTVIGVHTPEFPFEHNVGNVRRAVQQLGVDFPIVIDNDYAIWRAFENQYWPALYLVDGRGRIRHQQFGEGGYTASEQAIQRALNDGGVPGVNREAVSVNGRGFEAAADWANLKSPETYVGYERTANFTSRDGVRRNQPRTYRPASRLASNQWSLAGDWTVGGQQIALNAAPGRILYRFHARDVHLVMGPSGGDGAVRLRVSIDGQPPGRAHGLDVDEAGNGIVREQRLYQLVRQTGPILDRTIAIEFLDADLEAFAFTFG